MGKNCGSPPKIAENCGKIAEIAEIAEKLRTAIPPPPPTVHNTGYTMG